MMRLKMSIFALGISLSMGVLAESTLDSSTGAERDLNRPSTNGSPNIQDCSIRNGNDRLLCERQMQNDAARINDNSRINGNNEGNIVDDSRSRDTLTRDRQLKNRQLYDRRLNDRQPADTRSRDLRSRDLGARELESRNLESRDLGTRGSVDGINSNTRPLESSFGDVPLNSNYLDSNNSGTGTLNGL